MAESIISCPGCGKRLKIPPALAGKKARCPCGESIPIPLAGGVGVVPPLAYGKTSPSPKNEDHSAVIKQAVLFSALLIVLVGAIYGLRHLGSSSAAAAPSLGDDAMVQKMIDTQNGEEARQWINEYPGRMLSGMTISQAKRQIDAWYNLGVAKVYAFGGEMSLGVAFELPADPAKRQKIFDWANDWNGKSFVPPAKDVGQKYLFVKLRL